MKAESGPWFGATTAFNAVGGVRPYGWTGSTPTLSAFMLPLGILTGLR